MKRLMITINLFFVIGCNDPFVTEFGDQEDAIMIEASNIPPESVYAYDGGEFKVATWNIRFGIARFEFFADACGDKVILDDASILRSMSAGSIFGQLINHRRLPGLPRRYLNPFLHLDRRSVPRHVISEDENEVRLLSCSSGTQKTPR